MLACGHPLMLLSPFLWGVMIPMIPIQWLTEIRAPQLWVGCPKRGRWTPAEAIPRRQIINCSDCYLPKYAEATHWHITNMLLTWPTQQIFSNQADLQMITAIYRQNISVNMRKNRVEWFEKQTTSCTSKPDKPGKPTARVRTKFDSVRGGWFTLSIRNMLCPG